MDEIELLKKKLLRETKARKQAETILESKALQLHQLNEDLKLLNNNLEDKIVERTKSLTESEKRYRTLVEQAEDFIYNIDSNGNFLYINPIGIQKFGYKNEEIIGKSFLSFIPEEDREAMFIHYNKIKKEEVKKDYLEFRVKSKDEKIYWIGQNVTRIDNEADASFYYTAVARDITERKELQAQLEIARLEAIKAQEAEKAFLANMSHEIRTPLNAIIGMSHLLLDTTLDHEQSEYLTALSSSAAILKSLISDILDISKIDAGSLEVQNSPLDIHTLAKQLIYSFQVNNREKDLHFSVFVDPRIDVYLVSDVQLLNQILLNLLSNAYKFTELGEVKLEVKVLDESEDQLKVKFSVFDTGIGIDKSEIESIFQEFKQANPSIRKKYGGTGLGLYISRQLVALLGGKLSVNSKKGEGSEFFFSLDLDISNEEYEPLSKQSILVPNVSYQDKRALVVEDNGFNVKYITSLLNKWELDYDVSGNGLEAFQQCLEKKYDIIFMDLQMPVMDGFEATRKIRDHESMNQKVPIVALTASTFLSKKRLALEAGMTDFLSKPFTPDQLHLIITKYLSTNIQKPTKVKHYQYAQELDTSYLEKAYGGDLAYSLDMFETFLEIIEDELILLKDAIYTGEIDKMYKIIHRIKPTFAMVGITNITEYLAKVESEREENVSRDWSSFYEDLEEQILQKIPIIKNEVKQIKLWQ